MGRCYCWCCWCCCARVLAVSIRVGVASMRWARWAMGSPCEMDDGNDDASHTRPKHNPPLHTVLNWIRRRTRPMASYVRSFVRFFVRTINRAAPACVAPHYKTQFDLSVWLESPLTLHTLPIKKNTTPPTTCVCIASIRFPRFENWECSEFWLSCNVCT